MSGPRESALFALLQNRRSIRRFQEREIEAEKVHRLMQAALLAPSSKGKQAWEFIVVRDRGKLAELSEAKSHGGDFLKAASLGIVVCGDPRKSDVWVEDASIASAFLLLAAEAMGLGACWIQIRRREHAGGRTAGSFAAGILDLPERLSVLAVIAVGYPAESRPPTELDGLRYGKVWNETYGERDE